jgi:uncharacterized membrane protein YidH (DUF202 family)
VTVRSDLFDSGLQPERTLLAWRRTCLAFAVGSLIAMRSTVEKVGVIAVVVGVLGAALAIAAYFAAAAGYKRATLALARSGFLCRDAWPLLLVTLATLLLGVACAVLVVVGAVQN